MGKTINVRGRKELVAIFNTYGKLSGNQDQSRPQSATDFVRYIAGLSKNEETKNELRLASKLPIDVSGIEEVPSAFKIPVDVSDEEWKKAMEIFSYAFSLKGNPQMPYFVKVAGMACIKNLERQNAELGIIEERNIIDVNEEEIEEFKRLSTDAKLVEIYKLIKGGI